MRYIGYALISDFLERKKMNVQVTDQNIDTNTASGRFLFNILGAVFQFETEIRAERQSDGIIKAKKHGIKFGPRNKLTTKQVQELHEKRANGILIKTLMKEYQISKISVYRYLSRNTV